MKSIFSTEDYKRFYRQNYYQANKAKMNATTYKWREENPERFKEHQAKYYRKNKRAIGMYNTTLAVAGLK